MPQLYFVRAEYAGTCVFGGHWMADSAAHARSLGLAAYENGRGVSKKYGLPQNPESNRVVFCARRSKSDPASYAMNLPAK